MSPPSPLTVPDVQISRFLYLIRAVLRGSAAVARGVERSETTRATAAGDGPGGGILLDRADSPGATDGILRRERQNRTVPRRKGRNRCAVGRPRLRAPVQGPDGVAVARVFACTINRRLGMAPIRGTTRCTKNEDGLSVLTGHRKSMSSHSAMPKATRLESASSS